MNAIPLSDTALFLVNVLCQATGISGVALMLCLLFRDHPVVRQWVLTCAVICMLANPILTPVMQATGVSPLTIPVSWSTVPARGDNATSGRLDGVDSPSRSEALWMPLAERPSHEPNGAAARAGDSTTSEALPLILLLGQSVWVAGILVCLVGIARSACRLRVLRRQVMPPETSLADVYESVRQLLGAEKLPRVVCSAHINTPVATGVLRPLVILPVGLCNRLRADELCAVLLHEMAHALRGDQLVVFLQQFLAAFFWPHPLIHVLNRQLARAREEVCDNHALGSVDRKSYAETLLRVGTLISQPSLTAAPGFFSANWTLEKRIRGILNPRRSVMTKVPWRSAIAIVALFFSLGAVTAGNRLSDQSVRGQAAQDGKQSAKGTQETPSQQKTLRVSVWLRDGSRLVGRPRAGTTLPFAVGEESALSAESVWMVFRNSYVYRTNDDAFTVDFSSGKRKSGSQADGALKLSTALGDVEVPAGKIQQIVVDRMSPIHEQLFEGYHWLLGDRSKLELTDVGAKAVVDHDVGDNKWHWRIEQPEGYVTFYEIPYDVRDVRIWGSRWAHWPAKPAQAGGGRWHFVDGDSEFARAFSRLNVDVRKKPKRLDKPEQRKDRDQPNLFVYGSRYVLTGVHRAGSPPNILGSVPEKELQLKYDGRFRIGRNGNVGAIFVFK